MLEIKDYIRDRVDDQITWYDKKSQTAQKHYKRIQIIEIIASATIPIIVPYAQSGNAISILVAILGALIAILEAVVRNIEAIISSENNTWKALNTNAKQEATET